MKTRTMIDHSGETKITETDGKQIVRAYELLSIADFDTALTLLSLETGQSETLLLGALYAAKAMRKGKPITWTRWEDPYADMYELR